VKPYYDDGVVTLYHGDCMELLADVGSFDCAVVDPPYAETTLSWDQWIPGLPGAVSQVTNSMWCFGSLRMFLDRAAEFEGWKLSQDVIWEKHNGSSLAADRFKRVHEIATHWYRGPWVDLYREVPTTDDATARTVRRKAKPAHHQGARGPSYYTSLDGGPRLMRSVIQARSQHGRALHPTEKPLAVLVPLLTYTCPPLGRVLDPTAGSGSLLVAAKEAGRRAVGIEVDERYCEVAAVRLSQQLLPLAGGGES
jgi:site-specific DNA-methyltransferase (adenine-specific)